MAAHQRETSFGEYLRQFRLRAGLSQAALAEQANLSTAAITALERGARNAPYPRTLDSLARALELSPQEREDLIAAGTRVGSRRADALRVDQPVSQLAERIGAGAVSVRSARPVTATPARAHNVPVPPTALIGRSDDLSAATTVLDPADSAVRLLTLVGPGGVGKTRLAVAVAAQLADRYADGVVCVDLAPLHDHRLVAATIAQVLELRQGGGRSARDLLVEHLRARQLLLVLDNFEHLLAAAPLLGHLLARCPRLNLLVTSRAAMRLRGERRLAVPPLEVAAPEQPLETIAATAAVQLFVERAQAVLPEFELSEANAADVARICRLLDGLPLAIELAAARVGLLEPAALLRRLQQHRLPLLTRGATDLPARQQTLRSTLAWSYDLLEPGEQRLFRRLAVFAGGWTLEAAEVVCADTAVPATEVLDRLQALVDSSLVWRLETSTNEPRCAQLETVHEFAQEQLAAADEAEGATGATHRLLLEPRGDGPTGRT
jgi:predicted ATPase/transcriptional regulator with XRE-family HTH domain